eukprot:COSAG05_NODE_25958_length_192_cov_27.849462_1_plen_46_part_10
MYTYTRTHAHTRAHTLVALDYSGLWDFGPASPQTLPRSHPLRLLDN